MNRRKFIDIIEHENRTPLMKAAANGHDEVVRASIIESWSKN